MKKLLISLVWLLPCYIRGSVSIEADASAFFPTSSALSAIYGNAWTDVSLTIDHVYPFPKKLPHIAIFAQVDYLYSNGNSKGGDQKTKIQLVPITLGLKWIQKVHDKAEVYVGMAPKYYFLKINNDSEYVPRITHANQCGGYASLGSFIYPVKGLLIDLFFSYSYINFKAAKSTPSYQGFSVNASGFNLGGGVGWKF